MILRWRVGSRRCHPTKRRDERLVRSNRPWPKSAGMPWGISPGLRQMKETEREWTLGVDPYKNPPESHCTVWPHSANFGRSGRRIGEGNKEALPKGCKQSTCCRAAISLQFFFLFTFFEIFTVESKIHENRVFFKEAMHFSLNFCSKNASDITISRRRFQKIALLYRSFWRLISK